MTHQHICMDLREVCTYMTYMRMVGFPRGEIEKRFEDKTNSEDND